MKPYSVHRIKRGLGLDEIDLERIMLPNYRRCISCKKVSPKEGFWRIVRVFPSQAVQLEEGMGRSVYLCPQESCLQAAQKKNRLGRSLKATVPEEIYQSLWQRLSVSPTQCHLEGARLK